MQDYKLIGQDKIKTTIQTWLGNPCKKDTEIKKLLIWSSRWINNGEKLRFELFVVRFDLDMLKKE